MKIRNSLHLGVAAVAIALAFGVAPTTVAAQQAATVTVGAKDIGGVVSGPNGPEAGVWVIAETTDLPTKMSKTVVTDDQGRYLVPDLPRPTTSFGRAVTGLSIRLRRRANLARP